MGMLAERVAEENHHPHLVFCHQCRNLRVAPQWTGEQAFHFQTGILGMLAKTPFSRWGVSVMRETLTAQGYASALKCKSLISSSFPPYRRLQLQLLAKGMVRSAFLIQSALRTAKRVIYKKSGNTRIERI